jgi:tetraacyldisaccharide 4'-kinase
MKNFSDKVIVKLAATPLVFLYKTVNLFKRFLYGQGIFKSYEAGVPVISIGNTVMGGGGKTPMTVWLAEQLQKKKKRCVIITRGYGRNDENEEIVIPPAKNRKPDPRLVGDEPAMIARMLSDVPIICHADKVNAAKTAERLFKPDFILMDDGFQHLKIRRDCDIVVVPPRTSFWKREFDSAYKKADIIVRTGDYLPKKLPSKILQIRAERCLGDPINVHSGKSINLKELKGIKAIAVAGIADPWTFFLLLNSKEIMLTKVFPFQDHHKFTGLDIIEIEKQASGSQYILTTSKDSVRIELLEFNHKKWHYIPLHLELRDSEQIYSKLKLSEH